MSAHPIQSAPRSAHPAESHPGLVDDARTETRRVPSAPLDEAQKWELRALWLMSGLAAFRALVASITPIADGEAYYYVWSRFPSWSYYDHPPMVAWMAWLTTHLGAGSEAAAVRLGPVVCATLANLLLYRLTARHFSPRAGFFAVAIVGLLPAMVVTGVVLNPESPLAPLWLLFLLLLDDLRDHDEPWRPLVAGLVMGLAFLAKYTAVLLAPVALLYLASGRSTRRWLRRPSLYLGAGLALLVTTPVLGWNAAHHFPTLMLHFVERRAPLAGGGLGQRILDVAGGQLGAFHPLLLPGLLAILGVAIARARYDERYRLLATTSWPVLLFLLVAMLRVRDPEMHWTMVAILPLAAAAGGWLDENIALSGPLGRALRGYLVASAALVVLLLPVALVHATTPALVPLAMHSGAYDPRHDVTNEFVGWPQVTAAIAESQARLGGGAVVASCQYALCAHLMERLDDAPPVYCPSLTRTAFDFFARRTPPADAPVIYVVNDHYGDPPAATLPDRRCEPERLVPIRRGDTVVRTYRITECPPSQPAASHPQGGK